MQALNVGSCSLQADGANREMLELLAAFLPKRFPDRFSMEGTVLTNHALGDSWDLADKSLDPLEVSAQLVQVCLFVFSPHLLFGKSSSARGSTGRLNAY